MSVESDGPTGVEMAPGACKNAKDYALRRLKRVEEPLQPSQIASEYDCTPGHMRDALAELREDGEVERVGHGEYALSPEGATDDGAPEEGVESDDFVTFGATDGEPEKPRPSADGPALSPDIGGTAGDQEGEAAGIPLPVSSSTLIIVAGTLFLLVVVWSYYCGDAPGNSDGGSQQQPEEDSAGPFADPSLVAEGG